jgi:ribosome maturation factor RimP
MNMFGVPKYTVNRPHVVQVYWSKNSNLSHNVHQEVSHNIEELMDRYGEPERGRVNESR